MKRCSTLLITRKIQIKVQWGTTSHQSEGPSSKTIQTIMLERVWRKGNPPTLLVGMKIDTATMENSMEFPQKPKNRATIWSSNPTPGDISRKTIIQKDACTAVFIATLFTIARTWKQPKCPSTDEWIKKMWYVYTMEYYSAIIKNEIMPFAAAWMDLQITLLSEVSQTEKDKYHMISLICGI